MTRIVRPSAGYLGVWVICVVSTIAAYALLWITDTSVESGSLSVAAATVLVLLGIYVVYTWLRPDRLIGSVAGGLASVIWSGIIAGVMALAALRTHATLIDALLAHVDAALGWDAPTFVAWVAFHPPVGLLLDVAYLSAVPLIFVTLVFLGLTRRETLMWEFCFAFAGSATTCAFASAIVPAIGTFSHYNISSEIVSLLPSGAGLFYLPVFEHYRSGSASTINISGLEGVVCFPSFHAAMAFMIAYAWRTSPWFSSVAYLWSSLILISTIPIGGHYFADLLAASMIWAVFAKPKLFRTMLLLNRTASRPPVQSEGGSTRQDDTGRKPARTTALPI